MRKIEVQVIIQHTEVILKKCKIRFVGSPNTMKQEKRALGKSLGIYSINSGPSCCPIFDDILVAASLFESGNRRKGDLEATFLDHFLSTFSTLNNLYLVANVPKQAVI